MSPPRTLTTPSLPSFSTPAAIAPALPPPPALQPLQRPRSRVAPLAPPSHRPTPPSPRPSSAPQSPSQFISDLPRRHTSLSLSDVVPLPAL
ncbi:hypothetical protein BRADI_2g61885v3 [Brachypodium distachyon]|uniref:Uncharacterized protein n=1 Tax=Brachypodium distachyon TaxID=15368 RepID=A0A0Q3GKR0_BRADI|nr:hypothetical protein BRADI_2g61885v3 [Brachypodium distachyon]